MLSISAAVPPVDFTGALFLYGPLGVFCAWLMWREVKQEARREARYEEDRKLSILQETRREGRHEETQREIRMQRQSIDDLVRMMAVEVLSRPQVALRAAQDAQQIVEAVKARNI